MPPSKSCTQNIVFLEEKNNHLLKHRYSDIYLWIFFNIRMERHWVEEAIFSVPEVQLNCKSWQENITVINGCLTWPHPNQSNPLFQI